MTGGALARSYWFWRHRKCAVHRMGIVHVSFHCGTHGSYWSERSPW